MEMDWLPHSQTDGIPCVSQNEDPHNDNVCCIVSIFLFAFIERKPFLIFFTDKSLQPCSSVRLCFGTAVL